MRMNKNKKKKRRRKENTVLYKCTCDFLVSADRNECFDVYVCVCDFKMFINCYKKQ